MQSLMSLATTTQTGWALSLPSLLLVICLSLGSATLTIRIYQRMSRIRYDPHDSFLLARKGAANTGVQENPTVSVPTGAASDLFNKFDFPVWLRDADGKMTWCNAEMSALIGSTTNAPGREHQKLPISFTATDQQSEEHIRRRVSFRLDPDTKPVWYMMQESPSSDQDFFGFALNVDELVEAESTLSRFVATLTESFAQLSTGLIIFDSDRRVTMFNPAIADLLKLDPTWLATKPSFRDVMGQVREAQMAPEPKTSKDWKEFIQSIEAQSKAGVLSEKWALPSGQTFKITGRPHPYDAIALILEDISTRVALERRYLSELKQTRATLDFLGEAVCLFDTTGALVYCNPACKEMWGFDPTDPPENANIISATGDWSALCVPSPVWGELREFVTGMENRASWHAVVEMLDGRSLEAKFAPLPDGSTLTAFGHLEEPNEASRAAPARNGSRERDVSLLELAFEHMQAATLSETPTDAEGAGEKEDRVRAVDNADRLIRLRSENAWSEDRSFETLSDDLLALLSEKGAPLNFSSNLPLGEDAFSSRLQRLLINVVLVARALVQKEAPVDISLAELHDGMSISCMFKLSSDIDLETPLDTAAGLPYRILSRYVRDRSGESAIELFGGNGLVRLTCTLPKDQILSQKNERLKEFIA